MGCTHRRPAFSKNKFVRCTILVYTVSVTVSVSKGTSRRPGKQEPSSSTWDTLLQQEARNGLTRERIVAAGIALADQHGLAAVSIRRIAAQLGSSPMALYHHVPSKRDLLNLILDAVNAEVEWPAGRFTEWRSMLSHFARESRRSLKRHPWTSVLRAADPEYGPGTIATLESLLTTLAEFGLDMRTATRALGVLFVFVNGFVAAETGQAAMHAPKSRRRAANQPRFSSAVLATGKFPNVARFVATGAELPDDDGFERSLNWILDGIEADLAVHVQTQTSKRQPAKQQKSA
jgi:AcrR family transcriptional regulator